MYQKREEPGFIIKCPVCGQEYLPAELFMPEDIIGSPQNICKLENGQIDYYTGSDPDLTTSYVCDNCSARFSVRACVTYKVTVDPSNSEEYVATIRKKKITDTGLFNHEDNTTDK